MTEKNSRRQAALAGAALLAAGLLHLLINLQLTVYSDDYWYGTFLRDGLSEFARKTVRHYRETNGRVLIHILIPFVLLFDTKLFAVLSPLLTAAIFLVGLKLTDGRTRLPGLLFGAAMCVLTVLGSEIQYLRMSLYWLSAFFNYAAPLLPALGVLLFSVRESEKPLGKGAYCAALVTALLSGASTEQIGLMSLVFVWGWFWLLPRGKRSRRLLFLALTVLLGYATVLLAPGSHARAERGIDGGLLSVLRPEVFAYRFFDVMRYLTGCGFWNVLFAALCLLAAAAYLADRSLPKLLLTGFPAGAAVLVAWLAGFQKFLSVATVLYTLFLAVLLLTDRRTRAAGLVLLGAGASVMLLMVTTLYYARTFFPCVMLTILVCWSLLLRVLRTLPRGAGGVLCLALAALFVARFLPMYEGYRENKKTVDANIAAVETAKSTGEAVLSIDFDADYRFTMFFEGNYFLENFLAYYGLPADTRVTYVSDRWDVSRVVAGGRELRFPAVEMDGETLFPVEQVINAAGGSAVFNWRDHSYAVHWKGTDYLETEAGELYRLEGGEKTLIDGDCRYVMPFSYTYTLLYMSGETLSRCFGIEFDYDKVTDTYTAAG